MQILTCLIPYKTSSSTLHPDPNELPILGSEREHSLTISETRERGEYWPSLRLAASPWATALRRESCLMRCSSICTLCLVVVCFLCARFVCLIYCYRLERMSRLRAGPDEVSGVSDMFLSLAGASVLGAVPGTG